MNDNNHRDLTEFTALYDRLSEQSQRLVLLLVLAMLRAPGSRPDQDDNQ